MKLVVLVLTLCLITSFAFADVTAEIVYYDKDAKGKIRVWAEYKIDNKVVQSSYVFKDGIIYNAAGEQLGTYENQFLNGGQFYCTRYSAHNFAGFTDEQIEKVILYQSQKQCENLIKNEFISKTISTNDEIFDKHLKTLVGKTITKDKTELKIDDETTILISTDGTSTIKSDIIQ